MKHFYPFLFTLLAPVALSQVRMQNLFFNSTSNILRLNFGSLPPAVVYTGARSGDDIGEGIAHVEDAAGNIVIWVNASGVYDKSGALMPGSAGIMADPSSTEIVICPSPADKDRFYVFYNHETCSDLYYAVVDLRQRGGLGDVTARNVPIDAGNTYAEGLEIVKIPCTNQYWLLAYQCYTGFKRFRVSAAGIDAGTFVHPFNSNGHEGRGELDYHNGKLGYAAANYYYFQNFRNKVFFADFDPVSGTLRNTVDLVFDQAKNIYGLEFSPDASTVYLTDWDNRDFSGDVVSPNLFRYEFATGNITSWTIPYNTGNCRNAEVEGLGQIELGKDGKLYIPHVNGCQISVVENPDAATPAFSVIDVNAILSTGVSDHIQSEFFRPLLATADRQSICAGEALRLTASGGSGDYSWHPASGVSNPTAAATEARPAVTTTYTLYATNAYGCRDSVTVTVEVNAAAKPVIEAVGNNAACGNTAATLRATGGLTGYVWMADGKVLAHASADSLTIREGGVYRVSGVSNGCTVTSDEITIEPSFFAPPGVLFVPNVITPDGDVNQANETFTIKNYRGKIRLLVCNRWGREVYRSNDYRNDWSAEGLPAGVYYYHLSQESGCFPPQRGWVQVLR